MKNNKKKKIKVHAYNCYSHWSFFHAVVVSDSVIAEECEKSNEQDYKHKVHATNQCYDIHIKYEWQNITWYFFFFFFFFLMVCHISIKRKHWMATVFLGDIWFRFPIEHSTNKEKKEIVRQFEWRTIYGSYSCLSLSSCALHQRIRDPSNHQLIKQLNTHWLRALPCFTVHLV